MSDEQNKPATVDLMAEMMEAMQPSPDVRKAADELHTTAHTLAAEARLVVKLVR